MLIFDIARTFLLCGDENVFPSADSATAKPVKDLPPGSTFAQRACCVGRRTPSAHGAFGESIEPRNGFAAPDGESRAVHAAA